jgi:hypothetical protein
MFVTTNSTTIGYVQVHLEVEQTRPLMGQIRVGEDEAATPFAGWLELLRILSDMLAHHPRELDAACDRQLGEEMHDMGFDRSS